VQKTLQFFMPMLDVALVGYVCLLKKIEGRIARATAVSLSLTF
jgi:hypothetical protein